jgi:NADH-quinone oxidoreductase subunit G
MSDATTSTTSTSTTSTSTTSTSTTTTSAAPVEAPPKTTLTVTIDGRVGEANPGELLIAYAERMGTYIPRFCWHPRMREVGMCRMCLVEVDSPRGPSLQPACMLPVSEGMKVSTESPVVKKAQDGVLEFLLINHPLDCPVCDKGGECPLQDQTLTFGPGESRFVEEKRHYEKPIAISDLVYLDRERCILCDRCTRFSKEVAGDPLIHFVSRGNRTEVNTFPDDPFSSYFSGNVVQICPVGALTAKPYRFTARPWDLDQVESTCTSCSVGCRVVVQSSGDRITRVQGVDADEVNWGWLCDKGRFGFESVASSGRFTEPLVRKQRGGEAIPATWFEALERVASVLRNTPADQVGVIGGSRLTNEDAYAWAKLLKGFLRIDNVDAQLGDGLSAQFVLGTAAATIDETANASAVILLGPDLKEELPVLFLRLRDAAQNKKVPIIEISPKGTGMSHYARHSLVYRPGEAPVLASALVSALTTSVDRQLAGVEADLINAAAKTISTALASGKGNGKVVIVAGRTSLAESASSIEEAALSLVAHFGDAARILGALRRANVRGALDMGFAPGMLPGRVTLAQGLDWYRAKWGNVPQMPGRDTVSMLKAAAAGELRALILLGADPLSDVPDAELVKAAFAKLEHVVAVDTFDNPSNAQATVVLPAAGWGEKNGSTTNLEGRVSRLVSKVNAPGVARPDWMIAVELGVRLGHDLGFESVEDVMAEIADVAPAYIGLDLAATGGANGVVVPVPPVAAPSPDDEANANAAAESDSGADEPATDVDGNDDTVESDLPLAVPPYVVAATPKSAVVPQPDSYSLRLVSARTLYDNGTTLSNSASLSKLVPTDAVHLHPGEIERHGLRVGDSVRVLSQRAAVVLPIVEDVHVARGSAYVVFGQAGGSAAALIDVDEIATGGIVKVRLETVEES